MACFPDPIRRISQNVKSPFPLRGLLREFSLFLADSDGKLYDAYVAYPSPCSPGYNTEVENFAIHTLPQVLEKACGYKLFIAGRDCLPGQGNTPTFGINAEYRDVAIKTRSRMELW